MKRPGNRRITPAGASGSGRPRLGLLLPADQGRPGRREATRAAAALRPAAGDPGGRPRLRGRLRRLPGRGRQGQLGTLQDRLPLGDLGSNAVALGKQATKDGKGLLLGNPHFPWDGPERFYQAQLTIPGETDVAGASLFGVPLILIGRTQNLAWSHTVSTAFRFTPFELKLVPGSPTTYLYDGKPMQMTADKVTIQVRQS